MSRKGRFADRVRCVSSSSSSSLPRRGIMSAAAAAVIGAVDDAVSAAAANEWLEEKEAALNKRFQLKGTKYS